MGKFSEGLLNVETILKNLHIYALAKHFWMPVAGTVIWQKNSRR
jgi:hypothetical protein